MNKLMLELAIPLGVSGHESAIREVIETHKPEEYTSRVDHLGNLIWYTHGFTKTLLCGHMDECGIQISGYDGSRLTFVSVGGLDPRVLPNTVIKLANNVQGVIGLPAPHITKDRSKVIQIDDLRIDIGATSRKWAKRLVPIGTVGVMDTAAFSCGDIFFSRNTDNRAGCAALIMLARELRGVAGISIAFLVREEIGLMGSRAFINKDLDAKEIVNLDVCVSDAIGKGPVLSLKDGGFMADQGMVERFKELGAKNFEVSSGGTSDHSIGQLFSKTIGISLPSAYIHSAVSKVSLTDIEGAVELVKQYIITQGE